MRTAVASLGIGLAAVALAAVLGGCGGRPTAAGYDLVLVSLDTLRADRLGSYGHAAAATPALDRLAAAGVRFADVTAPAPLTLPSHATLLSGLLPPRHGLRHNGLGRFPDGIDTLATRLAGAGYRTAAFVGAFVLDRRFGLGRGFERYDDPERPAAGGAPRLEAERPAAAVIDRAVAWLDEAGGERPVFLWVHLYDAHAPYAAPEPWGTRFAARPYDGEIAYLDAQVDRLLAAIGRRGTGRAVVAVVGDHGEALGEHGERGHGLLLYEAALAVPWLVTAPGVVDAGRVVRTPVGLADVAPTLAGLLGVELAAPGALDGRDLAPALRRGGEPAAAALYAETEYPALFGWAPLAALRRGRLKLIAAPRPELYDVAADPAESRNLAAERRRDYRELAALLEEVRAAAAEDGGGGAPGVDAETRERLAALGYAAGLPASSTAGRADPKDRVELFAAYEDARRLLEAGDPETAAGELERLVAADPGNPVFRAGLALAWRRAGEIERAVEHYREAAAAAPQDPDAWQNLAAALRDAGRPRQALAAAQEALALAPDRAEARNLLALAYLEAGDAASARRELDRALGHEPDHAAVWNNLGNVLRVLKEPSAAEAAYRRAAELAPSFADPLNGLGTLLVELDRPREAVAFFDRVLELDPGLHEARLNRGIALELAGEGEAAAAAYRDFLARTGEDAKFLRQRETAEALLERVLD
jgi:arylsulfatase A-like enzyme/cytochrome c-type biogenesis protein CcmH/NrfG